MTEYTLHLTDDEHAALQTLVIAWLGTRTTSHPAVTSLAHKLNATAATITWTSEP
jgi:hypothetical protein